jgi:glucose/arabinose dehydrogenase
MKKSHESYFEPANFFFGILAPIGLARMKVSTMLLAILISWNSAVHLIAAAPGEVLKTKSGPVTVEHLAPLEYPWGMTFLPDGRLLVTEKPGRLRIFADGKLSEPVKGVPKVAYHGQGGLLDVELDPDFVRNRLVYFYFVEPAEQQPPDAKLDPDPRLGTGVDKGDKVLKGGAVARGRFEEGELRDMTVIWRQVPKTIGLGHFGGRLVFAPDGKLFIISGERQRFDPAQDLASNLGKVVRINPDGSIPADNPFLNKAGARPDIWTLGHRNPLGAVLNPTTKQLWIHEMGPAHGDELNIIERGKNYGWPTVSNGDHYDGTPIPKHVTRTEFAAPAYYWHPSVAPSGLIVYTGDRFPGWRGNVLLGGLVSEALVRLTIEGNRVKAEERISMHRRIRDVIQSPDGAVLLVTDAKEGELLRLTPR